MKKNIIITIITTIFIILSLNAFSQKTEFITINDQYAEYTLFQSKSEWSKKNIPVIMISQLEAGKYYDNYWHSSVKFINTPEIIEYLKEVKSLYIERDSINSLENNKKSYSYELKEINCLKGHKAELIDNLTYEHTYGVKIISTYMFTYVNDDIKKSHLHIMFVDTSNNNWISNVSLSFDLEQLNDLINKLESF